LQLHPVIRLDVFKKPTLPSTYIQQFIYLRLVDDLRHHRRKLDACRAVVRVLVQLLLLLAVFFGNCGHI
jgi:hypothetical protein